jgi:acyl-Coa thioesterase superfamily protein/acyl-CoA thioesterase superfamily protein
VSDFDDVTAVRRRGESTTYDIDLHPGWSIGDKPNGGYLLAVLARAGCDVVDTIHPLAISGHYLRAPSAGPAEVRTEVVRHGRRVSTSRATLWQGDKAYIDALITSGELHDSAADWTSITPPPMPAPEDCAIGENPYITVELFQHTDLRVDPATAPFPTASGEAAINFWFRLTDGADPDPLSLILAVDAGPPTVFNLERYGWAPTVEMTVLLRGIPAPGWLQVQARTTLLADGWFDEEATVWDSTGALVAQSRQLALANDR